ncbi:GntR family transcriptional regulator [Roseococcus sp. MDT2-1-1]|uniref:GntR family transcriptional regulator n=2 Tax=Sabulicella glaciei TaxID=2984948 RepID=A0ABT3P1V9_9PROT|nr:GntR family transcriptional regulator [Roseococcus sp. MDT2-1-1]
MEPRISAAELVYRRLRSAILSLALPPGATLARAELAARLGLSQTPVREALLRLHEEGLVEVVPQSATRVARIDLDAARQAHFLRLAVEVELVRRLAQEGAALAQILPKELERQRALLEGGDEAGFSDADADFHAALYEAGGVEGLWHLVRSRTGNLDRLRRLHLPAPGKAEAILAEHCALAEAILGGRALEAEDRLRGHMSGTFAQVEDIRRAYPEYF